MDIHDSKISHQDFDQQLGYRQGINGHGEGPWRIPTNVHTGCARASSRIATYPHMAPCIHTLPDRQHIHAGRRVHSARLSSLSHDHAKLQARWRPP